MKERVRNANAKCECECELRNGSAKCECDCEGEMQAHGICPAWQAGSQAGSQCLAASLAGRIPPSHQRQQHLLVATATLFSLFLPLTTAATLMGLAWFRLYTVRVPMCVCVCAFALHLGQGFAAWQKFAAAASTSNWHQDQGLHCLQFFFITFSCHFGVGECEKCSILYSAD